MSFNRSKEIDEQHDSKAILLALGKRNAPPLPSVDEEKIESEKNKRQKIPQGDFTATAPTIGLYRRTNTQQAIAVYGAEPTIFQGQSYKMLTHTRPLTPLDKLSCRGGARENILVDFQSTELKKYFNAFLAACRTQTVDPEAPTQPVDEMPMEDNTIPPPADVHVLQQLVAQVHSQFQATTESQLAQLIKQEHQTLLSTDNHNIAFLEWFWNAKRGFCRHQALACAYLLVHLVDSHAKQHLKTFEETRIKVYRFRTKLHTLEDPEKTISHAVIIYETENGHRYLLDSSKRRGANKGLVADLTHLSAKDKVQFHNLYYPYDGNAFIQQIIDIYNQVAQPAAPLSVRDSEKAEKKDEQNHLQLANAAYQRGKLHLHHQKSLKAIIAFKKSIAHGDKMMSKNDDDYSMLAKISNYIGILYYENQKYSKAITWFKKASQYNEKIIHLDDNKQRNFSATFHNLATGQFQVNTSAAIYAYKIAIFLREKITDKNDEDYHFLLDCSDKLCEIYFHQEKIAEAKDELQKAIAYGKKISRNQKDKGMLLNKCMFGLESLKLILEAKLWGFECEDVPHDGDCFFHTVAAQLALQKVAAYAGLSANDLRAKAMTHISQHFDLYKDFILEEDRDNFLERNAKAGTWPDNVIVSALSRELNVTMVVINNDGGNPIIHKRQYPIATIYLGYEVNQHYQSIKFRPDWVASKHIQDYIDRQQADSFRSISPVPSLIQADPTTPKREITTKLKPW